MDFTKTILEEWGFSSLVDVFTENSIDEDTFLILNENDIKELIPILGTRKKFSIKYEEYLLQRTIEKPVTLSLLTETQAETKIEDTISNISVASSNASSSVDFNGLHPNVTYTKNANATVSEPSVTAYTTAPRETVRKLLDSSEEGLIIRKSYGPNSKFMRNNLCNLIVKNELRNSSDKRISSRRFLQLAQEINDIFIHENPSIYYIPYTKGQEGKVVASRGKLWSTYVHQRQIYKRAGLLQKPSHNQPSCSYSIQNKENIKEEEASDEILDHLCWLRNSAEPLDQLLDYWQKTAKRRLQFHATDETIEKYMKKYPALNKQIGHILLNSDFNYLFQDKENCLFHYWPVVAKIIYSNLQKKRDSYLKELLLREPKEVTDDIIQLIALKYLPLLLQVPLIKAKIKHWKPSKQELLDGFIIFIKDIVDLPTTLENRLDKYNTLKITAQPIPIIVGTALENYVCYVSVNKVLYKVETAIKAVDLCFKAFHALNASYPPESEPSWMFLQQGIYKISTDHDKRFSSVQSLIADVQMSLENN